MKLLLNDPEIQILIQKMGITLLYSLGLGAGLSLLTTLVLILTRNSAAAVRYNLLSGLMCLFMVAAGFTLYQQTSSAIPANKVIAINTIEMSNAAMAAADYNIRATDYTTSVWQFLIENAQTITLLWLLIVFFKTFQMAKGLLDLRFLKKNKIHSIGKFWEDRTAQLAKELGIKSPIRIVQSGLIGIPMVIGHLKPMILIPLGVITSIPASQIEMILLHELAHILRFDFFVNLLQHLVELLFFFNPAILWLSNLIRKERENCCDDIALHHSGDKKMYINALLSFREYQLQDSVYTLAFAKESNLTQRAKRIAFGKNTTIGFAEKVFLTVTVLVFFTFSLLVAQVPERIVSVQTKKAPIKTVAAKTTPVKRAPKNTVIHSDLSGGQDIDQSTSTLDALQSRQTLNLLNNAQLADTLGKLTQVTLPSQATLSHSDTLLKTRKLFIQSPLVLKAAAVFYDSNYERISSSENKENDEPARFYNGNRSVFKPREPIKTTGSIGDQVLDAMTEAGVEYDRKDVRLHISNTELVVNGVKQSDEIHQKVISKFVKKPGDILDFSFTSTR